MFGYRIEEDFDLAKEKRRDRLWWIFGGGLALLGVLFVIRPFSRSIFQGYSLTFLVYGDNFYVRRKNKLRETWLWWAFLATIPLHLVFLSGIVIADLLFPNLSRLVVVYLPVLFLYFGIEGVLFDGIVGRFEPSKGSNSSSLDVPAS